MLTQVYAAIAVGNLTPRKAALSLALTRTTDIEEIQRIFDPY